MARPKLIEATLTAVEERGVTALTLDAVAEQAGVTKHGLICHFPSKHALIAGIHEELTAGFELALIEAAGGPPERASLVERTHGYVRAALSASMNVEMQLIMEAANEPEWMAPSERVYRRRWYPESGQPVRELDEVSLRCLVARMAADGAWGYEAVLSTGLSDGDRERLVRTILADLDGE